MNTEPTTVEVDGVGFLAVTEEGFVEYVMENLDVARGLHAVALNVDVLRQYRKDPGYRAALGQGFAPVADGMPIVWASRLAGTALPERVAGSRLLYSLSDAAARRGLPVLMLGGGGGSGEIASQRLRDAFPGLDVAWRPLPDPLTMTDEELAEVRRAVDDSAPRLVFVALGAPKQDHLISLVRDGAPDACWLGVGAAFDFAAGAVKQAPEILQRLGLEWAYRLSKEPGRLAGRYLRDDLPFALGMLWRAVRSRGRRRGNGERA